MKFVHRLGDPTLTWYGNRIQTGRSQFQLVGRFIYHEPGGRIQMVIDVPGI